MSNANILVIGNGFDLYHGLRTNYIDFVRFSKELSKTDKGTKGRKWVISNSFIRCFINVVSENQNWIDCEKEIVSVRSGDVSHEFNFSKFHRQPRNKELPSKG